MSQDVMVDPIHEAIELYNLQTNSTLLDYGLQMGFIEKTKNGVMNVALLNMKLLSGAQVVQSVVLEIIMRLGVYLSATGLVKLAIETDIVNTNLEDTLRSLYIFSVVVHQYVNFEATTIFRSLNRSSMCIAIVLFSLTTSNKKPCKDMIRFRHTIRHRLYVDYYLWSLLFAIDLALTCSSPLHISIEQFFGMELNMVSNFITAYCVLHLSYSMQIIGCGRLTPVVFGTPLIFLDASDDITLVKGLFLGIYYLCFWCSDWRELADWNHSLIHEAGVCKILNQKPYKRLRHIIKEARQKFDEWRLEEGLYDEGWFLVLDPPAEQRTNPATINDVVEFDDDDAEVDDDDDITEIGAENGHIDDNNPQEIDGNVERGREEEQQLINYADRVIYLQSRNPLLVWLAAIILIVWK